MGELFRKRNARSIEKSGGRRHRAKARISRQNRQSGDGLRNPIGKFAERNGFVSPNQPRTLVP